MKKPNFFIIGAPKCGTTALAFYLSEHPNVFVSDPKEPQYFCNDIYNDEPDPRLEPFRYTLDGYLDIFRAAGEQHLAVGEASPQYIISNEAIDNILAFDPLAKLIVMVRNPVDLVYSFHSQNLFNYEENVEDFKEAWSLNELRRQGECIPRGTRRPKLLLYDEIGAIGSKIDIILKKIPQDQLQIIFLDDLKISAQDVYIEALNFLEVPYDDRTSFPVINENKKNKSQVVACLTKTHPYMMRIVRYYVRTVFGKGTGILTRLRKYNAAIVSRAKLPGEFRKELVEFFSGEVEKIESITGRDLSDWRSL